MGARALVLVFLALTTSEASAAGLQGAEDVRFRTLLESGTQAAGLPAGIDYAVFIDLDVNSDGALTFRAALTGPGVDSDNDAANFVLDRTGTRLLARDGDQASALPAGVRYQGLCYLCSIGPIPGPRIDRSGRTVFTTLLDGVLFPMGDTALFHSDSGMIQPLLVAGDPAPGNPAFPVLDFIETPVMHESGVFAVGVRLRNDLHEVHQAILAGSPGNLRLVAETGDPAPDLGGNVVYTGLFLLPELGRRGRVSFRANLNEPGVGMTTGLFSERGGSLGLIARTGDPVPGSPSSQITFLGPPAMDAEEHLAILVFGIGVQAIVTDRSGTARQIARRGAAPRGLPNDRFSNLFDPKMGARGDIAYLAYLNGAHASDDSDLALFLDTGDRLRVVARRGEPAADLPGLTYARLWPLAINGLGQVVFQSFLDGPGVDSTNASALFLTDRRGRARKIARAGELYEVAPGDLRPIFSPLPVTFFSPNPVSLSDGGRLTFLLTLEGNEFVIVRSWIPERIGRTETH